MQSNEINELAAALAKAQGEFAAVPKGDTNPFFQSKYAGLPDVVGTASPVLSKNGLAVSQFIVQNELGEDCLKTYLLHSSGQFIEHSMKMYLTKLDSQGMGSATTYARRYSYMSVLGLVADEDDDGNKASNGGSNGESKPVSERSSEDARVQAIQEAAKIGTNSFVNDLALKWDQYGKLSEAQLTKGFESASKILGNETRSTPRSRVVNEPPEFEYAEPEDRF
jgi:hypothetical protein